MQLSEAEKLLLPDQLDKLIEYFQQIDELKNLENSEMIHPVPSRHKLRIDKVQDSLPRNEVLKNAPIKTADYFLVSQIINRKRKIHE